MLYSAICRCAWVGFAKWWYVPGQLGTTTEPTNDEVWVTYVTACTVDGQGGALAEGEGEGVRFLKAWHTPERTRGLSPEPEKLAGNHEPATACECTLK